MKVDLAVHLKNCINLLESLKSKRLLDGMGELMDAGMRRFVRNKLLEDTILLLKIYLQFPILNA